MKLAEKKRIFLSKVDEMIYDLCNNDFYSKAAREEMLKIFHLLLRENDPEQSKKVRRLFKDISDYLTNYGKEKGILQEKSFLYDR